MPKRRGLTWKVAEELGWEAVFSSPWSVKLIALLVPVLTGWFVLFEQLPRSVQILELAIAFAVGIELVNGVRLYWINRPDKLRRELYFHLDRLLVEAKEIQARASRCELHPPELQEAIWEWLVKLRMRLYDYGVPEEYRQIETIPPVDASRGRWVCDDGSHLDTPTSVAVFGLDERIQRLLSLIKRCTPNAQNAVEPRPVRLQRS